MTRRRRLSQGAGVAAAIAAALLGGSCEGGPSEPQAAATLRIVPDSVLLTHIGQRARFSAEVTGRPGAMAGSVVWTSTDTTVFTVDGQGEVTARGNGRATVVAGLESDLADVGVVRVEQQVGELEVLGGGQRTGAGQVLLEAVGVRVVDMGGTVVPPTRIRFEGGVGGGSADPVEAESDSAGVAWTAWTLGPLAGAQTLVARAANGVRAEIGATGLEPDSVVGVVVAHAGDRQWAVPGETLPDPVVVRLLDEMGRRVPGAVVRFEPGPGSGRVDPAEVRSDSTGLAATEWTLGDGPGTQTLVAAAVRGPEVELTAAAQSDEGVCGRHPAVVVEIVVQANLGDAGVSNCAEVTQAHLAAVKRLNLRRRGIRRLNRGDFAGLIDVMRVDLARNAFTDLPEDIFAGLSRLEELILTGNPLGELPPSIFAGLSVLRRLSLTATRLTEVPPGIFTGLSSLSSLYLSNNPLTELPPNLFSGLGNLRALSLSEVGLRELPPGIFNGLSSLVDLRLHKNQLTALPPEVFSDLVELELLYLNKNWLTALPPGIFDGLSKLERLWVYQNRIAALPAGVFDDLSSLEDLRLGGNHLTDLPEGVFDGLLNLTVLDLAGNRLTRLRPGVFDNLANLTDLVLFGNRLVTLPPGMFAGKRRLERVYVDNNPGAPFPLAVEFERADLADPLAPGPANVVMKVPDGAPFAFRMPVSVQRGMASARWFSVAVGDTASEALVVERPAGSVEAVHLTFGPPPGDSHEHRGFAVSPGEQLALFAATDNRSPVVGESAPSYWLKARGRGTELALGPYFSDPDGDSLAYGVEASDAGAATARIEGGAVWIEPRVEGEVELEVTATDSGGLRASQQVAVTVAAAADPDRFDIDVVLGEGFTEPQKALIRQAVERWEEVVIGDLPDVPFPERAIGYCIDDDPGPRIVADVDDVVIAMGMLPSTSTSLGTAGACGTRAASGLNFVGVVKYAQRLADPHREGDMYDTALHEIGHVLGIGLGPTWRQLLRNPVRDEVVLDTHFPGPLAIEAFHAAGGLPYEGGKVPVQNIFGRGQNGHWRFDVFPGEVMTWGGSVLSAITVQALADLGHEVDVSKADPYTLPGAAQAAAADATAEAGEPAFEFTDDLIRGPVMVVDEHGRVVRVIRP